MVKNESIRKTKKRKIPTIVKAFLYTSPLIFVVLFSLLMTKLIKDFEKEPAPKQKIQQPKTQEEINDSILESLLH